MKIRIEGCTQQELSEHSGYLTVGKDYEVDRRDEALCYIVGEGDLEVVAIVNHPVFSCPHLPQSAKWVEVIE